MIIRCNERTLFHYYIENKYPLVIGHARATHKNSRQMTNETITEDDKETGTSNLITLKRTPNTDDSIYHILHPYLKHWFQHKFTTFSIPQQFAVIDIHSRHNILVSASTGSGKTLTAFLSILNELIDSSEKGILENKIYCVYVSPLKALNQDIQKNLIEPLQEIEKIAGKKLGIRIAVRTGDTTASEKTKMLHAPPHILITTPESLAILLASQKFRNHLTKVDWFICDEIHALCDNKRGVHLSLSMERLHYLSPAMCRIGLSATVAPLEQVAHYLVGENRPCKIVDARHLKKSDFKVICPVPDLINTSHAHLHQQLYNIIDNLIQEHKTTLIFTNTRSATERVVDHLKDKFPNSYGEDNIGAHHGSLGKDIRFDIEKKLREGKLKACVSSTSLELGIDIGYVDLVVCLSSPKSVARFLQRAGRAGHHLHDTVKGRIIVMNRDDLIECAVLLKSAIEKKIDRVHIPENALDVLAQHIHGMAIEQVWNENALYNTIKKSYCYRNLTRKDFNDILAYLAGEYVELEERHIYARIWRNDGNIGKRGKLSRVLHMTNIGTIPDESFITVKVGDQIIGKLDEQFLERLKPGDVFLLGGNTYQFKFSRGMVAQVQRSIARPPTVPSWVSESLPLSFDLAQDIGKFRRLMLQHFNSGKTKQDILSFIDEYLYVDENSKHAIYSYFSEQYQYCKIIPTDKLVLVEHYTGENDKKIIFHTLYGRRVNDCLSRAIAYVISKKEHKDVEMGITDNGFYLAYKSPFKAVDAFALLRADKLPMLMNLAIEKTEAYKRRFRHCATRALMILRNYMGHQKRVGRQQVSSMILMKALERLDRNFSILKEAKREVLEDVMDIENTQNIIKRIEENNIKIKEINTVIPSPFSFKIAFEGHLDILKMEDKQAFLQRMHQIILNKIALDQGKREKNGTVLPINYQEFWKEIEEQKLKQRDEEKEELKRLVQDLDDVPGSAKIEILELIDGKETINDHFRKAWHEHHDDIQKNWPRPLLKFMNEKMSGM